MESHLANRPSVRAFLPQKMLFGMLLLGLAVTAHAVPISGEIGFIGDFTPVDSDWVQTDIARWLSENYPRLI